VQLITEERNKACTSTQPDLSVTAKLETKINYKARESRESILQFVIQDLTIVK
jgi:hypothetical protein